MFPIMPEKLTRLPSDVVYGEPIRRSCQSNLVRGINRFPTNEGGGARRKRGSGDFRVYFREPRTDGRTDGWTDALEASAAAETQTRRRYIACLPFVSREREREKKKKPMIRKNAGLPPDPLPGTNGGHPQLWSGFRFILCVHVPFP